LEELLKKLELEMNRKEIEEQRLVEKAKQQQQKHNQEIRQFEHVIIELQTDLYVPTGLACKAIPRK